MKKFLFFIGFCFCINLIACNNVQNNDSNNNNIDTDQIDVKLITMDMVEDNIIQGNYDDALKYLDEILEKDNLNSEALAKKGQVYKFMNNLDEAENNFNKAISINKNIDNWVYFELAVTENLKGNIDEAKEIINNIVPNTDYEIAKQCIIKASIYEKEDKEFALENYEKGLDMLNNKENEWLVYFAKERIDLLKNNE